MEKRYTIGQIHRLGLLKNHEGKPYKHKATISRIVSHMPSKIVQTPWGPSKTVSEKDIKAHNYSKRI